MTATETPAATYRFGQRDSRGLLLGLRLPQLVGAFTGLALLAVSLTGPWWGAALAVLLLAVVAAGLFVPLAGRAGDQWLPVVAVYLARRARGDLTWLLRPTATGSDGTTPPPGLPPALAGLTLQPVPVAGGAEVGVLHDRRAGTWTGVLAVSGRAFALLDPADQDRRVAAFGSVLASMAGERSAVHRVQWVERTVPDRGDALARHWILHGVQDGSVVARSYAQLIAGAAPVTQTHETYFALTVTARTAGRAARGSASGPAGVLLRELTTLQDRLTAAEVDVIGALPPRRLAQVLHSAFRLGAGTDPGEHDTHPEVFGPAATRTSWSHYVTDDGVHATYWIHQWPRMDVGAGWLAALLLDAGARRAMALIMEPVDSARAARQLRAARTADVANQALRDKYGQATDQRQHAEADDVTRREHELVAGHAEYRYTGYVTVSAATITELEDGCARLESTARQAHLELRRLHGQQDAAFSATLPAGRGL